MNDSRNCSDWRGDAPLPAPLAALGSERLAALAAGCEGLDAGALPGDVARVLACSDFVFSSCERDPAMLADLVSSGDLEAPYPASAAGTRGRQSLRERADSAARAAESIDALMPDLRRLRRREMARIAWRDIGGLADFDETVRDTSDLADALIDTSLTRLHEWQCADLGTPIGPLRRTPAARRARAGQARRERAELLLRHRPHLHLPRERADRGRAAQRRQRPLLPPARPQAREGARRADRGRLRLPRGHAAAPVREPGAARARLRRAGGVLPGARPRLGALRAHPRPRGQRRHGAGGGAAGAAASPSCTGATSTSAPSSPCARSRC